MAHPKNTDRRKRKYANQASRTARNKANRASRHELRMARFADRLGNLVGKTVVFRQTDNDGKPVDMPLPDNHKHMKGVVQQVVEAPEGAQDKRPHLVIRSEGRNYLKIRKRVKVV